MTRAWLFDGVHRFCRLTALVLLVSMLPAGPCEISVRASDEGLRVPDYRRWQLEEEATTYRPGTDLQFYPLELKSYSNPERPEDKVVELRRNDVLYILYHYTFTENRARWDIYMDAGFADAPCGFLDPKGKATRRYVRIDLTCLRDIERVDLRSGQ
ncbi:MAG: hypothetical protein ACE5K9_04420 [Candidatus Methylomirabilales bacterium]